MRDLLSAIDIEVAHRERPDLWAVCQLDFAATSNSEPLRSMFTPSVAAQRPRLSWYTSEPRIDRFALQGQYAEDALVDSAKWFVADEAFETFDA